MLKEPMHPETRLRLGLFMLISIILMSMITIGCSTVRNLGPGLYSSEYLEKTRKPGDARIRKEKGEEIDTLIYYDNHKPVVD